MSHLIVTFSLVRLFKNYVWEIKEQSKYPLLLYPHFIDEKNRFREIKSSVQGHTWSK